MDYFVHQSSYVDDGASIGKSTKIWHFSHISSRAIIGENVTIGQNVFVGNTAKIGSNSKIQNNVSVYDGVILEDGVFVGPSVVFTNVNNPRATVVRRDEYRVTLVKTGVTLGANSTIVCGATIGEFAFIAAGSVVKGSVKDYALMAGVPALQKGWMDKLGNRVMLPLTGNGEHKCIQTGLLYKLVDDHLEVVE
jgi:UDP-2-acetamido-3-amino-2,3-dideoxy-glucuronate N-acetyltransferase